MENWSLMLIYRKSFPISSPQQEDLMDKFCGGHPVYPFSACLLEEDDPALMKHLENKGKQFKKKCVAEKQVLAAQFKSPWMCHRGESIGWHRIAILVSLI